MQDAELIAEIKRRESASYGWATGELSDQRTEALNRFIGEKFGDEKEGRSQVVPTTLRDTYLWIAPQLLRVFLGTDEVIRFEPVGPEDEQPAQQETEVVNYVATQQNNAFVQFSAWFQDACLGGAGYVKVWWEQDESVQVERYFGKSDDEVAFFAADPEVEIIEQTTYPDPQYVAPPPQIDPMTGMPAPVPPVPNVYDVVLRRVVVNEYARYEAVPPEELRISQAARSVSLQDCDFVQHIRELTISQLREQGYDVDDDIADEDDSDGDEENARNRWDEDDEDASADPASRRVYLKESWLLIDYDGDGKAERRKVCSVGGKILANEEADHVPFACIAPILFAHRHIGLSLYDLLKEIEKIRVALTRGYLDGLYLSLRPRIAYDINGISNPADMMEHLPGGHIRTEGPPGDKIMPLATPSVSADALQGLQWIDSWKADATGVSAMFQGSQGLDAASLNKTAAATSQLISQAQMRVEAIARAFADTGVRDLFSLLHQLTLKHAKKPMTIRLRNQWTVVDPREWRRRTNLVVTVALGAGTKEMRAAQLQQLIGLQLQVAPMGLATPDKLYNSIARLCNELGYRNPDEFVSNPAMMPPQPPPPPDPLVQAEQVKQQTTLQKTQMELQAQAGTDQRELALKQAELQQQAELERFKAQLSVEQSRFEAELKAQTAIQIAQITEQIKTDHAMRAKSMEIDSSRMDREESQGERLQLGQIVAVLQQMQAAVTNLAQETARRTSGRVVRDARGRVAGMVDAQGQPISVIERDPTGRVAGVRPADNIQ